MVPLSLPPKKALLIWGIGVFFMLFQFFLQLSSGVIVGTIMREMQLTALDAGILSSAYYYIYTALQIPVGILFDRKSMRLLLSSMAFLCAFGCLIFSQSHHFFWLIFGRLLMGGGAAFAFVGLTQILRIYFPLSQFSFFIGLSETLGFIGTMLGVIGVSHFISQWGWRSFMLASFFIGLIIAFMCWKTIPDNRPKEKLPPFYHYLYEILKNVKAWINAIFVGLSFTVITVFAGMWAVPFIQVKFHSSLQTASALDSMIFLGAAVSCPLFGKLAVYCDKRNPLMLSSCLLTALLLLVALYYPFQSLVLFALVLFFIGLCCGAYMLSYSIANELASPASLSTCTGFTNTLAVVTSPLLQPLVGFILDLKHSGTFTLADYQRALLVVPIGLFIAAALVFFLPEKKC